MVGIDVRECKEVEFIEKSEGNVCRSPKHSPNLEIYKNATLS